MSIRRKSTTHDLATLRLHPDGSRVQQSSVNARHRTAGSTIVDSRGNWIARDAGGQNSVKKRRSVSVLTDDGEGEVIELSSDEEDRKRARSKGKGKQRAGEDRPLEEVSPAQDQLNTRTKRRLSFVRDLSFLDPSPYGSSSVRQDASDSDASSGSSAQEVTFAEPAPELLKSIHHFASCYYRERGQLFDSSRNYRGSRKERRKQGRDNIHVLAAETFTRQAMGADDSDWIDEEEGEEGADDADEDDDMGGDDSGRETPQNDSARKDMYKAFDGSALMALGIVLQEHIAHTLSSRPPSSKTQHKQKRRRKEPGGS
ncbi:hypothetical protein HYDPIDRAFT_104450 [Hydnomerulius pinastri MD-312]|nr:hypothetical protein HYDPIDRAFT_104450 [Hydnomerulius pinastri MD-312]